MLLTVVLATAVLMTGAAQETAPPSSSAEPVDLIATLDTVCIAAQGDAARAAELAAEAGFSPMPASMIPPLRNASEQAAFMKSNGTDVAMYRVGQARVMLAGDANDAACAIVMTHPTGPWRDTLAGLVAEMDLRQIPSAPVEGESNSWAAPNRYALSYTLSPVGGLIVSVSRSHFSMTHEDGVEAVETSGVEATPYP